MSATRTVIVVQFALTLILLTWNLGFNVFRSAEPKHFAFTQIDIEAHVLGRMLIVGKEGLLSYSGFLGKASSDQSALQLVIYLEDKEVTGYTPYKSQVGLQGQFAAAFDLVSPWGRRTTLQLLHIITAFWTALAVSLLLVWLGRKFGPVAWASALVATLFSPWVTVLAKNLYWASWAFYLPACVLIGMLWIDSSGRPMSTRRIIAVSFAAVLVKCLFNGFEFVTTTLLMMVTPIVIVSGLDRWRLARLVKWGASAAAGSVLAILVTLLLVSCQIALLEGSFSDSADHLVAAFERRSRSEFGDNPRGFRTALNVGNIEVLKTYLAGTAIGFERPFDGMTPRALPSEGRITYGDLLGTFGFFSVIAIGLAWWLRGRGETARRLAVLVAATGFAGLAPLSWFVLFKAHAYIHTNVDFIVWHMPFVPIGFALCGAVVAVVVSMVGGGVRRWRLGGDRVPTP